MPRKKDTRKRTGRQDYHKAVWFYVRGCPRSKGEGGKPFKDNWNMERHLNMIHLKRRGKTTHPKYADVNKSLKCDICGWEGNHKSMKAHRGTETCIERAAYKKSSKYLSGL